MKKNIILSVAAFAVVVVSIGAGFAISGYMFFALEMNDRLKYEVAYLKGYVRAQNALKSGDVKKAESIIDFMIDAHVHTLYEFDYLSSSAMRADFNSVLCEAVTLRKSHPTDRGSVNEKLAKWYEEVDRYLSEENWQC